MNAPIVRVNDADAAALLSLLRLARDETRDDGAAFAFVHGWCKARCADSAARSRLAMASIDERLHRDAALALIALGVDEHHSRFGRLLTNLLGASAT